MIAAAAGLLAACSFFVPFSEYDKDTNAPDSGSDGAGDAPAPDAGDAADAAQTCDADTQIDKNNCGACGRQCISAAGCTAGLCETEGILNAPGTLYLTSVAADPVGVYFGGIVASKSSTAGVLGVMVHPSDGVSAIAITSAPPVRLSLTATDVYWTQGPYSDAGTADRGVGHTSRTPPVGDAGPVFGPLYVTGQDDPFALSVDTSGVLFTDPMFGAVWTAALTAPANERPLVTDLGAAGLARDANNVFWSTALPTGNVMRAGRDGSNPQTIANNQATPAALAIDDHYVYWTSYDQNGAIYRVPKVGGTPPLEIARDQNRPAVIAVDDKYVYWGNLGSEAGSNGSIARAPKGGGKTLVLAVNQKPVDLAVDDTYVYWPSGGVVYRVAK
jgi:hypothetical protein